MIHDNDFISLPGDTPVNFGYILDNRWSVYVQDLGHPLP